LIVALAIRHALSAHHAGAVGGCPYGRIHVKQAAASVQVAFASAAMAR